MQCSNLIGRPVFSLCETEKIRRTGRKKNIRIFGVRMFAVYVEASIGSCCFIPVRHRVRNSFSFFALSEERPLKGVIWCNFLFPFCLVCYVAVCACIRSAELQSSKSPTKGFILSKREGLKRVKTPHSNTPHVYVAMWKYLCNASQMCTQRKKVWFQ